MDECQMGKNKQTNKQTTKQPNNQTTKQPNKQPTKQTNKQTNKQLNKQTASQEDNCPADWEARQMNGRTCGRTGGLTDGHYLPGEHEADDCSSHRKTVAI